MMHIHITSMHYLNVNLRSDLPHLAFPSDDILVNMTMELMVYNLSLSKETRQYDINNKPGTKR